THRSRPTDAVTRQPDPLCMTSPTRPAIGPCGFCPHSQECGRRTSPEEWNTSCAAGPGRSAVPTLICQRYGIDVTPGVGLAPMGRPAVAEKPRRIGISAVADVLHAGDAGGGQAGSDIAGEVE